MEHIYSTYEARAKFSEVLRRVRAGHRVLIAYRGEPVAEIRPLSSSEEDLEKRLARPEEAGLLGRKQEPTGPLRPLAERPGAVARLLESRG